MLILLRIIQKRVLRIITDSPLRTPSTPLFSELQLLKLDDVYKLQVAKIMHTIHDSLEHGKETACQ